MIVPVEVAPPATCGGENEKPLGAGGCTLSVTLFCTPSAEAVMATGVRLLTGSLLA